VVGKLRREVGGGSAVVGSSGETMRVDNGSPEPAPMALLYTAEVAAARLRVRESTLRCWAREGKVPCRRLGRALRFSEDDLRQIVEAAAEPARAVEPVACPVPLPRRNRRPHRPVDVR